jgi:flagellar biosynthesis protein FliQ
MNSHAVVDLIRQTFWMTFWVISLIQIVTSIQDASFGAVPRLLAFLGALMLFLPWMLGKLVGFTAALLGDFSRYAH